MTDRPNCLAIEVRSVQMGALPVPLMSVKDSISKVVAKTNLNLRWESDQGKSLALIDLPEIYSPTKSTSVTLEFVELSEGQINVAGRTGRDADLGFEPRGAVYKIASTDDQGDRPRNHRMDKIHSGAISLD